MDERTKTDLINAAKGIVDPTSPNANLISISAFINYCKKDPEGVRALYTDPENGSLIKKAVNLITSDGSGDPSKASKRKGLIILGKKAGNAAVKTVTGMTVSEITENASEVAKDAVDTAVKTMDQGIVKEFANQGEEDPNAPASISESLRDFNPQGAEALESMLPTFEKEGIKTNKQLGNFVQNAANLGFTPSKIYQFASSDPDADPEKVEATTRRAIRFIQQAQTLTEKDGKDEVHKLIRETVSSSSNAEEFMNKIVDLSGKKGNEELSNFLLGFGIQEATGGFIEAESSRPFVELMTKWGLTPQFATNLIKGTINFGKELMSDNKKYYNKSTPLYDQGFSRFTSPYRKKAIEDIEARQQEAGIQNIAKLFGISHEDAETWHGILTDPTVRTMSDQALKMLFNAMGDQDGSKYELFMENKDALLDGFSGDAVGYYDTMAKGTSNFNAMMQIGQAASLASMGPTLENRWLRADDLESTYRLMRKAGWNVEDHIVRGSGDVKAILGGMTEPERGHFADQFAKEYAADELSKHIATSFDFGDDAKKAALVQEYINPVTSDARRWEIADELNINTEQLEDIRKDNYAKAATVAERMSESGELGADATKEEQELSKRYIQRVGGYNLNQQLMPMRNALRTITTFMNLVPEAAKLNGGKKIDEAKAYELMMTLGGSDPNADPESYARRVTHIAQIAARNEIPLERAISAVSESGKMLQQMGLSTRLTQVVGEAGLTAYDAAFRASGGMADPNRLLAQTQQDAANVANSQISRNITWLIANEGRPNMSDDLNLLAQKAREGTLTDEDLKQISNTAWLKQESGMTGREWEASVQSFESDLDNMDSETALNVQLQARRANQMELMSELRSDRFRNDWQAKAGAWATRLGYDDAKELNDANLLLLESGMSADRREKILSGTDRITDQEAADLREYGKQTGQEDLVERIIANANKAQEGGGSQQAWLALKAANDKEAQTAFNDPNARGSDMDRTMARESKARLMADARRKYFAEKADIDMDETFMEQLLKSDKEGSSWWAYAVRAFFGDNASPEKISEALQNGTAGAMIISNSLNAGSSERFFDILFGENNSKEARDMFRKNVNQALGTKYKTDEELYTALQNMSGEQLEELTRSDSMQSFRETLEKRLSAITDDEIKESKDDYNKWVTSARRRKLLRAKAKRKKAKRRKKKHPPATEGPSEGSPETSESAPSPEEVGESPVDEGGEAPVSEGGESPVEEGGESPETEPASDAVAQAEEAFSPVAESPTRPETRVAQDEKTKNVHVENFSDMWV